jgi:hypothetical protein
MFTSHSFLGCQKWLLVMRRNHGILSSPGAPAAALLERAACAPLRFVRLPFAQFFPDRAALKMYCSLFNK